MEFYHCHNPEKITLRIDPGNPIIGFGIISLKKVRWK